MLLWPFVEFYFQARTKYQLHTPFVYELVQAVLEDRRRYYAFRDIEAIRQKMLASERMIERTDYGAGAQKKGQLVPLRKLVQWSASSARQGRRLFRLAHHFKPNNLLELGGSTCIGTMYLAAAARNAPFISLEGCPNTAAVAQSNLQLLDLKQVQIRVGPFESQLPAAIEALAPLGLVYLDGNHRLAPTMSYFEACLAHSNDQTVFVFDDMYWSREMMEAWKQIKAHPRVRLTVDFYDLSLVFINPGIKVQQHWKVVPPWWKPWKVF